MQGNRPPGPARGRPVSSSPQPTYSLEDDIAPYTNPELRARAVPREERSGEQQLHRQTDNFFSFPEAEKEEVPRWWERRPPASFAGRRSPRSGTRTATWSKSMTSTKKTLGSSLTWRSVKKEPAPAPSVQNTSPICPAMSPHARRRSGRRERKKRGKARERARARAHPTLVHKTTKNTIKCSKKTKKSKKI